MEPKNTDSIEDENLISLDEWKRRNPRQKTTENSVETPRFRRLGEDVINRLSTKNDDDDDDSLNDESFGVGLAAMVQLAEAVINTASDALKSIKKQINDKIDTCLKYFIFRR
ncbi:hypothetical protein JW911_01395 [Candidatus Peregrinibacteria bacterium]|nr:hypothetical protein [Candidatus Peregrinibacteria bacterium]